MRALLIRAAAEGETATSGGLAGFMENKVIQILLLLGVAGALWAGKNGNISKTVTVVVCVLLGLGVLVLSANGGELGKTIAEYFVNKIKEDLN